jgi:hypothetical protein
VNSATKTEEHFLQLGKEKGFKGEEIDTTPYYASISDKEVTEVRLFRFKRA